MHKKIAHDIQQGSAQVPSFRKVQLLEILVLDHLYLRGSVSIHSRNNNQTEMQRHLPLAPGPSWQ